MNILLNKRGSENKGVKMKGFRLFTIIGLCVYLIFSLVPPGTVEASVLSAPKAPSNLTATYYPPNKAVLTWKDNSKDETKFALHVVAKIASDNSQCPDCPRVYMSIDVIMWEPANTTKLNLIMQYGSVYTFSVAARGKSDTDLSAYSNSVTVTAPPIPPTKLVVNKTNSGYNATWKDNSNNEGINVVAIGYPGGITVLGYKPNTISAAIPASAIPASAIPASAKIEFVAGAIPASAIPASFKKSGDAIPASVLNVLKIPSDSGVKYFSSNLYLPLMISSNLVKISK
jgi:hypothetical protein